MNREIVYRNIAYFGGLFLIVGLFINFSDPDKKGLFDIVYDTTALTTFTFAYLWRKRRILLIGLLLYTVDFNIDLLFNPTLPINDTTLLTSMLKLTGIAFHIAGFGCLILGLWDKFENKYLTTTMDFGLKPTLTTVVLFTGLIQTLVRLI